MNQKHQTPRYWQFRAGTLLLCATVAGPLLGLLLGAFGESKRVAAVGTLVVVATYVLPIAWYAMVTLAAIFAIRLFKRLNHSRTQAFRR